MAALQRAQNFIDTVHDKKNDADKVKKEGTHGSLSLRPATPIFGSNRKKVADLLNDDKRRRATILF